MENGNETEPKSLTMQAQDLIARSLREVASIAAEHGVVEEKDCDGDEGMLTMRDEALASCEVIEALATVIEKGFADMGEENEVVALLALQGWQSR